MARSHRELEVWRRGLDLAADVYRLTRLMPRCEEYRLSSQMIRAASSVPANLAEGNARATRRDYAHFVSIARGSLAELETFLLLAQRLDLAPAHTCEAALVEAEHLGPMLTAIRIRLTQSPIPNP